MRAHYLGNLVTDSQDRVERGHRILEDHGDFAPANGTQLVSRQFEQVFVCEEDFAALDTSRRVGYQTH